MTDTSPPARGDEGQPTIAGGVSPSNLAIVMAAALLPAAALLHLLSATEADPDLWGHLRFGLDIVGAGGIIHRDPFSYLTNHNSWINHEWLAEVLFALAYGAGGVPGLVLLKAATCLATLGLVWRHAARQGLGLVAAGLFTLVFAGPAVPWMLAVRPQIFTYLGFAAVLIALHRAAAGRPAGLALLPAIFALWANLHGGFLAGLAALLAWAAGRLVFERPPRREAAWLAIVVVASFLAVLLNPYGWGLPALLLRTATVARPEIDDWQPLRPSSPEGIATLAVMILALGVIVASRRRRNPPLLLVLAMVSAGPFVAHRHVPLAMLAAAILTAEHAADLLGRFAPPVEDSPSRVAWPAAALIVAMALMLAAAAVPHFASIRMAKPSNRVPAGAVAALKAAGIRGNLAVPFGWGEYVIWHLGPSVKVSVDGRRETVYPEEVYAENLRFLMGSAGWDDLVRRPETDLILTDRTFKSDRLMDGRRDWVAVYEDDLCRIFARPGSRAAESLRNVGISPPPPDAFPG